MLIYNLFFYQNFIPSSIPDFINFTPYYENGGNDVSDIENDYDFYLSIDNNSNNNSNNINNSDNNNNNNINNSNNSNDINNSNNNNLINNNINNINNLPNYYWCNVNEFLKFKSNYINIHNNK